MRGAVVATARLMAAALLAASLAACSDDGDGTGPTPTIDVAFHHRPERGAGLERNGERHP